MATLSSVGETQNNQEDDDKVLATTGGSGYINQDGKTAGSPIQQTQQDQSNLTSKFIEQNQNSLVDELVKQKMDVDAKAVQDESTSELLRQKSGYETQLGDIQTNQDILKSSLDNLQTVVQTSEAPSQFKRAAAYNPQNIASSGDLESEEQIKIFENFQNDTTRGDALQSTIAPASSNKQADLLGSLVKQTGSGDNGFYKNLKTDVIQPTLDSVENLREYEDTLTEKNQELQDLSNVNQEYLNKQLGQTGLMSGLQNDYERLTSSLGDMSTQYEEDLALYQAQLDSQLADYQAYESPEFTFGGIDQAPFQKSNEIDFGDVYNQNALDQQQALLDLAEMSGVNLAPTMEDTSETGTPLDEIEQMMNLQLDQEGIDQAKTQYIGDYYTALDTELADYENEVKYLVGRINGDTGMSNEDKIRDMHRVTEIKNLVASYGDEYSRFERTTPIYDRLREILGIPTNVVGYR